MRAQRFQTLITSLLESIWVSALIDGHFKGRGRLLVNFSFLHDETIKLGPQRVTVKSSDMSWGPLFERYCPLKFRVICARNLELLMPEVTFVLSELEQPQLEAKR